MARRIRYDTQATWDDPTERPVERRHVLRSAAHLQVKIAVRVAERAQPLVGPGIADNISIAGMYCRSKHTLAPGQAVELYISMKDCPRNMGLPRVLTGLGHVIWTKDEGNKVLGTAIRFGQDLADDINLALFVDYLASLDKTKTPPPGSIRTPYPGADLSTHQRI